MFQEASKTVVETDQLKSSVLKAEPDMTVDTESKEDSIETESSDDLACDKLDNRIAEKVLEQQQLIIPDSCLALESSILSDTERYG